MTMELSKNRESLDELAQEPGARLELIHRGRTGFWIRDQRLGFSILAAEKSIDLLKQLIEGDRTSRN
jgi:hypothetical protein